MDKIIILKGLPGSGKTIWAHDFIDAHGVTFKRISKDDLRLMLDNGHYSPHTEDFILKARNALIDLALQNQCSVIVDDTNVNPKHINDITALFKNKATIEVVDFTKEMSMEECIINDRNRTNKKPIGEQNIRDMHRNYLAD